MTYTLVTAAEAVADYEDIQRHISEDCPERARRFVEELRSHARLIATHPLSYRVRPDFGRDMRAVTFRGYLLFYRVVGNDMRLLRVMHGARDLSELTFD